MIISISEAARKFKVSRSKLYRMKDSGQISFAKKPDNTIGVDHSELIRVFGERKSEQQSEAREDNKRHDLTTENFYLKKEIEVLTQSLQRSEERVDRLITVTQEQVKPLLLTKLQSDKSFWQRLWKK